MQWKNTSTQPQIPAGLPFIEIIYRWKDTGVMFVGKFTRTWGWEVGQHNLQNIEWHDGRPEPTMSPTSMSETSIPPVVDKMQAFIATVIEYVDSKGLTHSTYQDEELEAFMKKEWPYKPEPVHQIPDMETFKNWMNEKWKKGDRVTNAINANQKSGALEAYEFITRKHQPCT